MKRIILTPPPCYGDGFPAARPPAPSSLLSWLWEQDAESITAASANQSAEAHNGLRRTAATQHNKAKTIISLGYRELRHSTQCPVWQLLTSLQLRLCEHCLCTGNVQLSFLISTYCIHTAVKIITKTEYSLQNFFIYVHMFIFLTFFGGKKRCLDPLQETIHTI